MTQAHNTVRVSVSMPIALLEELDRLVGRHRRGEFIVQAAREKLSREKDGRVLSLREEAA
jgi:metal-responsive CopG/Arc/MetJ family transcriptional regulator